MSESLAAVAAVAPPARDRVKRLAPSVAARRGAAAVVLALLLWQAGAASGDWLGAPLPILGALPSPAATLAAFARLVGDAGYWRSCAASAIRVAFGFAAATLLGAPFGLTLAFFPRFRAAAFPAFELLRPIPPLAWVPAAIIFWPTQELSIGFVIFLGGFYTVALNVLGGADAVDIRLLQSARSLGASRWTLFRRVLLPAILPSLGVGMETAIGVTWEVVVAAEMISGGGSGAAAASGGGLGFFIWSSYVGGAYPDIVVGMISIGFAGFASSALTRRFVIFLAPWAQRR